MPKIFDRVEVIPGEITSGFYNLIDHPTGHSEKLSIVVATGMNHGPTLLLTANIHGNEVVGVIVIHRLLEQLDLKLLNGKIVCIPSLNPTGHRAQTRYPIFDQEDPNRKWPDSNPEEKEDADESDWLDSYYKHEKTSIQEEVWKKVFKDIQFLSPDYHVDLHTFSILSIPFIFLDRILYDEDEAEAKSLFEKTKSMVDAMGLTMIVETPTKRYINKKLQRSTSGMTLNKLRIPSCTIELGPMNVADPYYRDAAVTSITNLLRWAKMIPGNVKPITRVSVIKSKEYYRYLEYPQANATGIVDFQKNPGDFFGKNDVLAKIRSIDGKVISEVKSELEGFIIGWWNNIAFYKGNTLGMVAVPDRLPMVEKWSDIKEKNK